MADDNHDDRYKRRRTDETDDRRNYRRDYEDTRFESHRKPHHNNYRREGISSQVANHYNNLRNNSIQQRGESRIFHMRNFNNWLKSIVLRDTVEQIRSEVGEDKPLCVLDLGCGKGGDLFKFEKYRISTLIGADIAETSIEHCRDRYRKMRQKRFEGFFFPLDCTRALVTPMLPPSCPEFDMTSCQFVYHYSFETFEQARTMIQNASERLRSGGYFCGTIPDSYEIVKRLKESGDGKSFGNDVYKITFERSYNEIIENGGFNPFGEKYNFHLDNVVDCPEFLVNFDILRDMCKAMGLVEMFSTTFESFYAQESQEEHNQDLLKRMKCLEFCTMDPTRRLGAAPDDYEHLAQYSESQFPVGTLSKSEWEAITLYRVFSFQKV